MRQKKILLIDDDPLTQKNLTLIFKNTEFQLDLASDSEEGLRKIKESDYDVVLSDIIMPDLGGRQSRTAGIDLLKIIVELKPELPVIMISVIDNNLTEALKLGAKDYIEKNSLTKKELIKKVENQIFYNPLKKEITNILRAKKEIDEYDLLKIIKMKGIEIKGFRNILKEMENEKKITVDSFLIKYNEVYK